TAALIAKLEDIANRPAPSDAVPAPEPQYFDWVPVTVGLKDEHGKPVPGDDWKVTIGGELYRDGDHATNSGHPNAEGVCDLGPVRLGVMGFNVESSQFSTTVSQSVRPGKPYQLDMTVPTGERETVEQSLFVHWPEEVRKESLWTHLVLAYQPIKVEKRDWVWKSREIPTTYYTDHYVNNLGGSSSEAYRGPDTLLAGISVLISPEGKLFVGELQPEELYLATSYPDRVGGHETIEYSKLFSQNYLHSYHYEYADSPPTIEVPASLIGSPSESATASYLEYFPLVHFREAEDAESKLFVSGKLALPKEGIWVYLMSVIAPVGESNVTDPANGFSGRVVSVSSRPLNYWGVGGFSSGIDGYSGDSVIYSSTAMEASPLAEMLSYDEERNSWKFVPSEEVVRLLQKNLAKFHHSLEARRSKKPEETDRDAPSDSPSQPKSN
ncbi:MAG TPA: hypothetical protein VMM56_03635, partial [Planctomycetaceae bacterium]|nr:hypothetical protein [Planctomycetaceae bacterium]